MKRMIFETIGGRTYEVKFNEDDFLCYMEHCYNNLPLINEIALFLNNVHSEKLYEIPFDSAVPASVKCNFSQKLLAKFRLIADTEKYNL